MTATIHYIKTPNLTPMSDETRWKIVRAHINKGDKAKDKAEQHYIAAGQYLNALKAEHDGVGRSGRL